MGWRYFTFTLGAITFLMFVARFFLFHLYESPKFLLARGRQAAAVATIHGMAHRNGRKTWLTEEILNEIGGDPEIVVSGKLSTSEIVKRKMATFSTKRIMPLFATKKLGITSKRRLATYVRSMKLTRIAALVWFCWTTIGMGYPLFNAFLPQYLANAGAASGPTPTSVVYRNYAITSVVGVPGSALAYVSCCRIQDFVLQCR